MKSPFLSAVFLQFMGTIGSGIFVLPYLFHQSNFLFASLFLLFLALVVAALNQFYVDIISHTKGDHQLAGYAKIYLGKRFHLLAVINLLLLSFGAITAYIKLFSQFFILLFPSLNLNAGLLFYLIILFSIFIFRDHLNHNIMLLIPFFMLFVPIILFIYSFPFINHTSYIINQPLSFSFFGATLFALSSFTIIPEVGEILGNGPTAHKHHLSGAVFTGLLLAVVSYFLYIISVILISGTNLSINSVSGLFLTYPLISRIIAVFGMLVTARASLGFLIVLRELFYRDLKLTRTISDYLPLVFPFFALLLGNVSLITIISLTGHITIFVSAIIICLIRLKISHNFNIQFFILLIIISLSLGIFIS